MEKDELSDFQRLAIAALMAGATREQAAETAGVSERTVYAWLREPHFREKLRQMREQSWTETTSFLHAKNRKAAEVLEEVMADSKARGWERVAAAKAMLEMSRKAVETDDLGERMNEVERKLEAALADEPMPEAAEEP